MKKTYIFEARKLSGKTQVAVAKEMGMLPQTYAAKEQRANFTPMELVKLGEILGMDLLNEVKNIFNENAPEYGLPGSEYRELLSAIKDLSELQRAQLVMQAEILANQNKKPVSDILATIKELYKKETGRKIDF